MIRVLIGSLMGAIVMFLIGFLAYGTPLMRLGFAQATDAVQIDVQTALKALPGTGTYVIPSGESAATTAAFANGPVATINYNAGGFAMVDPQVMLTGFIHMFITALLLGLMLWGVRGRVPDFPSRARLVIGMALVAVVFTNLADPIWLHHDWRHAIYVAAVNFISLCAAGHILARWFVPAR